MPDLTATGVLSRTLTLLRSALADMTAFQTWCGVANDTAAEGRIVYAADEAALPARPFVVLRIAPGSGGRKYVATETAVPSGTVQAAAFGAVSPGYRNDPANALIEMQNQWDALLACLTALDGAQVSGIRLQLTAVRVPAGGEAGFVEPVAHAEAGNRYEQWEGLAELVWGTE